MTNREIGFELGRLAREERKITNEILALISMAMKRRAFVEHGFPSMFEWMVRGFGYSHAAAYRRIEAARLLDVVPNAAGKLESGELNLTTLSKTQTIIRMQEKTTGQRISRPKKAEIVRMIEKKSARQVEHLLYSIFPEAALSTKQETTEVIDASTTRYCMNLDGEMSKDLERAKEVLSHKFPNATNAEIVGFALKFLLDEIDPLRQSTSAAASKRVTKSSSKRKVLQSSDGACTYQDPVSGQVCGSRHQVQIDHIIPKALGGTDNPENLRPLCRQHNLYMAEQAFGKETIEQYRRAKKRPP